MAKIKEIELNNTVYDVGGGNVEYTTGGGTEDVDLSNLYIDSQGATYSFYYDYDYGTIRNNNQQVDESFAYASIELYLENDADITISFSQSSEQNYDFGEISELDEYLTTDNQEDVQYLAWSGKEYSDIEDSITFSNVTAGYHFFTVKYIKDSSSESGDDTFEITAITIGSGSGGGSLIDTNTQEEIPLSQINDMPQALQDIINQIPDTNNFVTIDTKQMMTAPKAITGTDVPWGSDQVQKNLFMAVSNSNTTPVVEWIGRSMFGANNLTFLMGTINGMAALGAHSWTSAKQGTGAAWADIYINPDGDKAVKIGGSPMVGRPSILVIKNEGQVNTGTVKINRRPLLTQSALYKDVACWDDNVSKFTNDAGYITSSALSGYATQTWVGQQGYITGIDSTDVENALGYTPSSYTPPLFSPLWSDHLIEDESYLRADTFSWQDGTVYSNGYGELVDEYNDASSTTETEGNIIFKRTPKGYKIALANQEQEIVNAYNNTGIAYYYILDTTNTRFKLPRTKFGFEGLRTNVGDPISESLPNIKGQHAGIYNSIGQDGALYGAYGAGNPEGSGCSSSTSATIYLDASRSSSTYQDNAPVQERATQMYLYFYVGEFTPSATAQTAGLNSSLFNGKVDLPTGRNQNDVALLVEEYSGSSWYRVYSDGWCEQGGRYGENTGNTTGSVFYLKEFTNNDYCLQGNLLTAVNGTAYDNEKPHTPTTTGFSFNYYSGRTYSWYACGYIS